MDALFQIESTETFQNLTHEIINTLFSAQAVSSQHFEIIRKAKEEFKKLIIKNSFNLECITKEIEQKNWDEKKVLIFQKILTDKKKDILIAVLQDFNSNHGEVIADFNWNLKFILGTSELKMYKYPILQLLIATYSNGKYKKTALDISSNILSTFIIELERVLEAEI